MTQDDDEALAPGHVAGPRSAPRTHRFRGLIPFYKNARHWKFTNAQILVFVGVMFAASVLVLAGAVYYAVGETQTVRDAVTKVDQQRAEGRKQRLQSEAELRAAQARTDLEIARLACINIRYIPQAKAEIERGLNPSQQVLVKNCQAIAAGATPVPRSTQRPTRPPSSPGSRSSASSGESALEGGPTAKTTSPRGRPTPSRPPSSSPSRSAPRPTPKPSPSSSPLVNLAPVLCGVLGLECPPGA